MDLPDFLSEELSGYIVHLKKEGLKKGREGKLDFNHHGHLLPLDSGGGEIGA